MPPSVTTDTAVFFSVRPTGLDGEKKRVLNEAMWHGLDGWFQWTWAMCLPVLVEKAAHSTLIASSHSETFKFQ